MSSGHYHKRWSASTGTGRTTPTSVSLSSSVEPSTYGTSWNSVRWNKPSTGYRSQSSSIAARFEKPSYSSPSPARGTTSSRFSSRNYGSDAAKTAASLASLGPSISSRASRFDSTVRDNKEKYRTEARELLSKWTSRERPTADNSYLTRKPFENSTTSYLNRSNDYPYRKSSSMTPTRSTVPAVARYSSLDRTSSGILSPSPTPQSQTPKMERPWRQRMAEASRIRATHGDEVSASYMSARRDSSRASSRRGSLSQASGDELGSTLGQIRTYLSNSGYTTRDSSVYGPSSRFSTSCSGAKKKEEAPIETKYMSRSYSPVRSPMDVFRTESKVNQTAPAPPERSSRPSSRESVRDESKERHVSAVPKNPTIRESSKERDTERRKTRSSRERTARRNSRQRSQQLESSSSGDEADREEARRRRRRRRNDAGELSLPPSTTASVPSQSKTSVMQSSMYDTGKEELAESHPLGTPSSQPGTTGATCLLVNASEDDFQSCAGSPAMGQKISRNNSATRLPSKSQIIKSPSIVEVPGISKSDSRPEVTAPSPSIAPSVAESTSIHLSNSLDNLDELHYDSEDSSVQGDESQYSAVAHFKPYKPKVKRIAPVPGLWQKPGEAVCISKNKAFVKEEEHKTAFTIIKVKTIERVSKKIAKKRPLVVKNAEEKKEQKITQESPVKKLFLGRKKSTVAKLDSENEAEKPKETAPSPKPAQAVQEPAVPKPSEKDKKTVEQPKTTPLLKKQVAVDKPKEVVESPVQKPTEPSAKAKPASPKTVRKVEKAKEVEPKAKEPVKDQKEPVAKAKEPPAPAKTVPKKDNPPKEAPKPQPPKEETKSVSSSFSKRPSGVQSASVIRKDKTRVVAPVKKLKAIGKPAVTSVEKVFNKQQPGLRSLKTIKTRPNIRVKQAFKCKAAKNVTVEVSKELMAKSESTGAQVIVDRPQKGVNAARVKLRCRQPQIRQSMPSQSELAEKGEKLAEEFEKAKLRALAEEPLRSPSRESQSKAAEMLDEMRFTEPALEWRRRDSGGQLILPDKSILEEYVKRKRGRLERLHSEPLRDRDEQCESPANSTTSELLPACAVRVFGASPREIPVITAPSRTSSVDTPTAMLDSIQPISFNNFNSTPQGFLRNNSARLQCSKPIKFDAPKTPFEERLQQQANAIRKHSVSSAADASELREPSPRRNSQPAEGMSISSAFTAAMAEKAGQSRHERYAAHIPVNRGETSGRQSAASIDSTQSGVLDTATKQLDQVIDQARHRHHQHRSKFKEAIDYLDQIFEDLKKECDVNPEDKNNNSEVVTATASFAPKEIKRPTVIQPSAAAPLKTNSLPDRAQRHNNHKVLLQAQQSPVELTVGKKASADSTPPEATVTETIVLPRKTDKLDFTRRWLQDDLSSLAQQPPAPIAMFPEQCMYTDADEHSLGSCSAEVAAINASTKKEKTKKTSTTTVPKIVTQPAPIRPQPQRPQPLHSLPGSSNGSRHFPVEFDGLQRVASFDHVQADRRENSSWRAGSQEPYQTLGSIRSETDALRPSPSAFTNVNMFNQRGGIRASLRSLPDASVVRGAKMTPPRDPALAIDQLVAELELNTEQPTTAADKRRSFPTSLRAEAKEPTRTSSERQGSRGRGGSNGYGQQTQQHHYHQQPQGYSPAHQIRHQRQQRSLDEAASMLQNVVGDFGMSQQKSRKSQAPAQFLGGQSRPFETINQEKINPSRVEAMHNMFERGGGSAQKSWRTTQQLQPQHPQPYKPPKEEELYYDLADYAVKAYKRVSPPRQVQTVRQSPLTSSQEFTPAYPLTQPPQHPPGRNGSANSSTNGGYYSSNSSTAGPSQPAAHRSSLIGRQSLISSRGPSVDDEDDGFYDNIGVFDDRRYSRGSEMDVASISSRPPPNSSGQKHNRIGSFLRKIGGSSRPPGSAASLISLNKVANEAPIRSGVLMKSNSLSNEPWKQEVLQQSMPRESSSSKGSLGARLKNSLFGSKKRLNG